MRKKILIIGGKSFLQDFLGYSSSDGFHIETVIGGQAGLDRMPEFNPSVVILDAALPDMNVLEVLEEIQRVYSRTKTIIVSSFQDMDATIRAMKLGAYDFVRADINPEELKKKINKAIRLLVLKDQPPQGGIDDSSARLENHIVGQSKAILEIFKFIGLISNTRANVGIRGETGTGKELVARMIHEYSPYKDEPFITIDCSSVVETLSESILYGHEKGSFTGAIQTHIGKFELAREGTLFLDEIGELPLSTQSKLLRFLQEKEFERVGGKEKKTSRARIIAATNMDLYKQISLGKFRKDLYYRLKVLTIYIPPLRERKEDIPLLIAHFLHKINQQHHTGVTRIEDEAVRILREYLWPGNVRELENLLTWASILGREDVILKETVSGILNRSQRAASGKAIIPSLKETEGEAILKAIHYTNWNLSKAAKLLKISRPTLRKKIQTYQVHP
jgi:two-component system response regulator AtoC